jgi:hypothetical protein
MASRRPTTKSRSVLDRHDVSAGAQPVEAIGPSLHHLASFVETLCTIVGSTNLVALRMSELQFDKIRMLAFLIQQRARHAAGPVIP